MRILLVTDAWAPQVNGVVRTLQTVSQELERLGHTVRAVTPSEFRTIRIDSGPTFSICQSPGFGNCDSRPSSSHTFVHMCSHSCAKNSREV